MLVRVTRGRLTKHELGWLLTQQAQGASERLRKGVQALRGQSPAPVDTEGAVETTLDSLEDTMRTLERLHRTTITRGRRGRVDVAAVVWEVAPEARVSIEPGGGTSVWADDADLRRMLYVLIGHDNASDVRIVRSSDMVRIEVTFGPDSGPRPDTERAWLSRIAIWYGGFLDLDGRSEVLSLPAAEDEPTGEHMSSMPIEVDEYPSAPNIPTIGGGSKAERLGVLARFIKALALALRAHEGLDDLRDDMTVLCDLDLGEPRQLVDLTEVVQHVVGSLRARAIRRKIEVSVQLERNVCFASFPEVVRLFVHCAVAQAIYAAPLGSTVRVSLIASGRSPILAVHDVGAARSTEVPPRGGAAGALLLFAREVSPWLGVKMRMEGAQTGCAWSAAFGPTDG